MCAKRLEVTIDVLDCGSQRALPLTDLMPADLIAAILQEFREIERLGIDSRDYCLLRAADQRELDPNVEIGAQLSEKAPHLLLVERPVHTPPGAQAVNDGLYLREETGARVYRLAWLPAIIGRSDPTLSSNQLVAADLESLPTGLRVSRRHVRITQEDGRYWVEALSSNPASLRPSQGAAAPLHRTKQPIASGDVIYLNRSEVALKFIVHARSQETAAAGAASAGTEVSQSTN